MKKILLFAICSLFFVPMAYAICPVCTIAIGAGLTFLEIWGVDLVLAGIWAGAMTMVMVFWTAKWLNRHNIRNALWYLLDLVVWYGFLGLVYTLPNFRFGGLGNTLWGADKLLLGIIVGSVVLYVAEKWNANLRKQNGGKSYFPFQKVIIPIASLAIATAVFSLILYI